MKKSVVYFILGIVFTISVSIDIVWWIQSWQRSSSVEQVKKDWLSKFPVQLRDATFITMINAGLLGVSAGLFWLAKKDVRLRIPGLVCFIITSFSFLWQLFSLS